MTILDGLAWIGQGFFFCRFFIQWLASERAKRSVAPAIFWWLSLAGSVMVGIKAVLHGDAVPAPGYLINGSVYLRNLWLSRRDAPDRSRLGPLPAALLGLLACGLIFTVGGARPREGLADYPFWLAVGIAGAAAWILRFPIQWWFSERAGRSYFPRAFWWFSLVGAILNIAYYLQYGLQLGEWVYFVGVLPTPIYIVRNLMLGSGPALSSGQAPPPAETGSERARPEGD